MPRLLHRSAKTRSLRDLKHSKTLTADEKKQPEAAIKWMRKTFTAKNIICNELARIRCLCLEALEGCETHVPTTGGTMRWCPSREHPHLTPAKFPAACKQSLKCRAIAASETMAELPGLEAAIANQDAPLTALLALALDVNLVGLGYRPDITTLEKARATSPARTTKTTKTAARYEEIVQHVQSVLHRNTHNSEHYALNQTAKELRDDYGPGKRGYSFTSVKRAWNKRKKLTK